MAFPFRVWDCHGLPRQDKTAPQSPDLLKRDFIAAEPNQRWVGNKTEIATDGGILCLLAPIFAPMWVRRSRPPGW